MAADIDTKIRLIKQMIQSLGKLVDLEAKLRDNGDTAQADEVDAKYQKLRDAIDDLRGQVATEWTASAAAIEEELKKHNAKVQATIRRIEKNINTANNVVKILGQVDEAINAVAGLIV